MFIFAAFTVFISAFSLEEFGLHPGQLQATILTEQTPAPRRPCVIRFRTSSGRLVFTASELTTKDNTREFIYVKVAENKETISVRMVGTEEFTTCKSMVFLVEGERVRLSTFRGCLSLSVQKNRITLSELCIPSDAVLISVDGRPIKTGKE